MVKPYYVQLYFNEKDYEKAIVEGNDLLQEDISSAYKAEVHKIIGESYFMQKQYAEAYPHLKAYLQTQQNPSESDLYEMGFVAANLQKFDEAISYYNQLVNSNSAFFTKCLLSARKCIFRSREEARSFVGVSFGKRHDLR